MGVSKNGGTPKPSILIGFSIINHPFWGTLIFGNTYIDPETFGRIPIHEPTQLKGLTKKNKTLSNEPRMCRFSSMTTIKIKWQTMPWMCWQIQTLGPFLWGFRLWRSGVEAETQHQTNKCNKMIALSHIYVLFF